VRQKSGRNYEHSGGSHWSTSPRHYAAGDCLGLPLEEGIIKRMLQRVRKPPLHARELRVAIQYQLVRFEMEKVT